VEEFLAKFNAGELIGFVAVAGGLLCGLLAIALDFWHKIRKAEIVAALKRDMLNRGMTAEDIAIVLDAGSKRSGKVRSQQSCNS